MALNALQPLSVVDPFTQIYVNIRETLLTDAVLGPMSGLSASLQPGNFPDLTDPKMLKVVIKDSQNVGDNPQVLILQGDFELKPYGRNSRIGQFSMNYLFIASFSDQRLIVPNMFKYRLLCAFSKTDPFLGLKGLVEGCEAITGRDDVLGQATLKDLQDRWSLFGGMRVHGYVERSALASA